MRVDGRKIGLSAMHYMFVSLFLVRIFVNYVVSTVSLKSHPLYCDTGTFIPHLHPTM